MERRIGAILREARKRREIELSEVEAATRIRGRYLRAIEDEDWEVLPGDVYARGFIRTYASFLGLDGERLAGEYRETVEGRRVAEGAAHDLALASPGGARHRSVPGASWIAVAGVVLVAVAAIVALPVGENGGGVSKEPLPRQAEGVVEGVGERQEPPSVPVPEGVSMRLATNAEVWVCILDEGGQHLVDGQILEAGAEEGPFHSGSFTVSFGNGEVSMLVDGKEAEIPATPNPIGYSIDASGQVTELSEADRPTCT